MKKLILLLAIALPLSVYAQRFQGGIMAGFNVSQIDGDGLSGYNKAGLVGGAYVMTDFTERWGAQMEIRYSAKGSATPKDDIRNIRIRLQYIEIPLVAKFEIVDNFDLEAGLSFGYLFNASRDDGYGYVKYDEIDGNTDLAICVGLGYSFFERLTVNIRYSYSIFPLYANYTGATYESGAYFNNVITFGFYIRIG